MDYQITKLYKGKFRALASEYHVGVAEINASAGSWADQRSDLETLYDDLWNEYGASLGRLAASYEALPHAREDLLQDIRLAIWSALPKFRQECSLRTFVYRIAHNRGLTHVWSRRAKPQHTHELSDVVDPRSDPESTVIQKTQHLKLIEAVRQLPILYRQVITLFLENLSHAEIGAVLGITETNVAVRLNRARKLLVEKLRA